MPQYNGPIRPKMRVRSLVEPERTGALTYGPISWISQTICYVDWDDGETCPDTVDVWDLEPELAVEEKG